MSPLESKLRRVAVSLDASALEALASKGLLRRAQKDLERGIETRIAGETPSALRIKVGEFETTLPESGPATATCSCPAVGVCQHILTAVLFLQRAPAQTESSSATAPESSVTVDQDLMKVTPEELEKWAGKTAFKAGLKLASQSTPEMIRDRAIRIRFPAQNSEIHVLPGAGLDGMIVSGGKGDSRQFIVAAVVAFQQAAGKEWVMPAGITTLEASEGAPRSRAEVLDSCQTLLEETLSNGLSRLAAGNQQRWATLAVSALGVNLPRLALSLRGVGDEATLILARDARSDPGRMLTRMGHTHALCSALQNGAENLRPDLVGMHRTRYDEIGHLDLVGAAAWPWRTASGYEGLTVLFWDHSGKSWNSWSESRPRHQLADFKPTARYSQPGPWEGAESPRQLARSTFRLMNARRNPSHRLSASSKSRALVTGGANLHKENLPVVEDWAQLVERSNAQNAFGLKETNPLDFIFVLRPSAWGQRGFDPVRQDFTWLLGDCQQRPLLMEIAFDQFAEPGIQFLENLPAESLHGALVIGRIQRTPRGLSLHPYSIHRQNGEIIHLFLDTTKAAVTAPVPASDDEGENSFDEEEEEAEPTPTFSPALGRILDDVDDGLLALAEAGLAAHSPLRLERIRQIVPRAQRLALEALATVLNNVATQPRPWSLLRCAYLAQLHRQAMT